MKNNLKVTKILDKTFHEIKTEQNPIGFLHPRMLICKAHKHVGTKYSVLYIDPSDPVEKVNGVANVSTEEVADMICENYEVPTS